MPKKPTAAGEVELPESILPEGPPPPSPTPEPTPIVTYEDELSALKRKHGVVDPAPPAAQPAAQPARVARVAPSVRKHFTELYPDYRDVDPQTGELRKRLRTGGQFSARRILVVNPMSGKSRTAVVRVHDNPQSWPISGFERVADPENFPGDPPDGNVEVIFDHPDQLEDYLRSYGLTTRHDPLKLNDTGSAFLKGPAVAASGPFNQSEISPPPGGWAK